jgi:flagellar hook assembly protein FlgD
MGNLAVRSYIYSDTLAASGVNPAYFPKGFYQNDIKKAIFISPPHQGSNMAEFVIHYMAAKDGYEKSPSGILKTLNIKSAPLAAWIKQANAASKRRWEQQQAEYYPGQKRSNGKALTEFTVSEQTMRSYAALFVQADYQYDKLLSTAKNNIEKEAIKDRIDAMKTAIREKIKTDLDDAVFDQGAQYLDEQTRNMPSSNINLWLKEQMKSGLAQAAEKLGDITYTEIISQNHVEDAFVAIAALESLDTIKTQLASFDLQKEWNTHIREITEKLEQENLQFDIHISVGKDWPLGRRPVVHVQWNQWNKLSVDYTQLGQDLLDAAMNYRFTIKMTPTTKFKASLEEIKAFSEKINALQNPMNRLFQIITEVDQAPLWSFPTKTIILEANNYLAKDEVKDFLDYAITQFMLKNVLEDGAMMSLLKSNPTTLVLNEAELPDLYDPVQYYNVISRGSIAFNRTETEQFNQFFYGDLPALRGASKEFESLMNSWYFPTVLANAYQIKLMASPSFYRLPSGEARLGSVLLSYSRGLFTKEGDGAVDLDSLRGKNISHLKNASNYYEQFGTSEIADYVDSGFFEETVEAETMCQVVELGFNLCGMKTPPYVRGSIRLYPMFHFISIAANNNDSLKADLNAHSEILKPEHSLRHIEESLYDTPLIVLKNIYTVSGNETTELSIENYQEQTDPDQVITTLPILKDDGKMYNPLAYNIKSPKISLNGLLYDFAPHQAKLEYSYNFAPFVQVLANRDGSFAMPILTVAEGQNILTFRVTNKLGRSNNQFVRIIRSSSPLLASDIFPVPLSCINTPTVSIQATLYNAQFISNNINASQIDELKINGKKINSQNILLTRGYNNAYRNYVQITTTQNLSEGENQVEITAHDTYGHSSYTAWPFTIDLTPPQIYMTAIPTLSLTTTDSPFEINYTLTDNISVQLHSIQISIKNDEGITIYHAPLITRQTLGDQHLEIPAQDDLGNPLVDGEYLVIISCYDQSGNRSETESPLIIDSAAPKITRAGFDQTILSTQQDITFTAQTTEPATGYLRLFNNDRQVQFTYALDQSLQYVFSGKNQKLPDGKYTVQLLVEDSAKNIATASAMEIVVDCTPPQIYGTHAEPMILSTTGTTPYSTVLEYQVNEQQTKSILRIQNKASGQEVARFTTQDTPTVNQFIWAADPSLPKGVYLATVSVSDVYGNTAYGFAEIIKDGLSPEITTPLEKTTISGVTSIIGKVSDGDWTNVKDFDNYALFWAEGERDIPENLNQLDQTVWHNTGIEVPFINRGAGMANNVSARAAQDNTVLAYWNTEILNAGTYTLLVLSAEKDLGYTTAAKKTYLISNEELTSIIRPYAYLKNPTENINFVSNNSFTFNFANTNKPANIALEIINPKNEVVKYSYFPNIAGINYYGKPLIESGESGTFVWQDEQGWHALVNESENTSYNITLCGIDAVTRSDLPYVLKSGILNLNGSFSGHHRIDFKLQPGISSLYIDNTNKNTKLGAAKDQPLYNPYIIRVAGNSSDSDVSFIWDGHEQTGAYADSGIYTIRFTAAGTDGNGYRVSETTTNIITPFRFKATGLTPINGTFDTFDPQLNSISFGYNSNRNVLLTAEVIDQPTQAKIAILSNQEKVLGSNKDKTITWNGCYPNVQSTQRKTAGTYILRLTAETNDGQKQVIESSPIIIRKSTSTVLAQLQPIGNPVTFNGQIVNATAGSSEYYWSARADGTYTPPTTFSYRVSATGQQLVSTNPFVPFAGLYHRGFNKFNFKIKTSYGWHVDYDYKVGWNDWESRSHNMGSVDSTFSVCLTQLTNNYTSSDSKGGNCNHRNASSYMDGSLVIKILDINNNEMDSKILYGNGNGLNQTISMLNGAINVTLSVSMPGQDTKINVSAKLVDNIKYSRLSNRFYAWYGYVNKDTGRSLDFAQWYDDLGKLGFVPSSYFQDGIHTSTTNVIFTEKYPVTLDSNNNIVYSTDITANQLLIASMKKANVDYETMRLQTSENLTLTTSLNQYITQEDKKDRFFYDTINKKLIVFDAMRPEEKNELRIILTGNNTALTAIDRLYSTSVAYATSYRNYLSDEYCEFIPLCAPLGGQFTTVNITQNMTTKVAVQTNYSQQKTIPWPVAEEYIRNYNNTATTKAAELNSMDEIKSVDYSNLPSPLDANSISFGGLGSSIHEISGIVGQNKPYTRAITSIYMLPVNVIAASTNLTVESLGNPDVEIIFDNNSTSANYTNGLNVSAKIKSGASTAVAQEWSTEKDPYLKQGIIDSTPLVFNELAYRPESNELYIKDAYFAALNRPVGIASQNIHPIDYYTFLDHDYYNQTLGQIMNPNLTISTWNIAVYDQTGQINSDLSISNIQKDDNDILNNKFSVRLNLDAVEKRYVALNGQAAGPYELLYFDGQAWQTISTGNTTSGHLGWWNVGQLNGRYTVALKVYEKDFGIGDFNLSTQEIYIGEVFYSGNTSAENKRVSSPYKRAEVFFHPNSYASDKFITVSPVKLDALNIKNKPDIYTLGPIAEILPHGSTFNAENRPSVVFRYSHDDIAELKKRGTDIHNLGIYYLNESGEIENANAEIRPTDYGVEIWTVLNHFSPYTILEGEVPMLPKANVAFANAKNGTIRIYGKAKPQSTLEVYVDDDQVFGDNDAVSVISSQKTVSNVTDWILHNRKWNEDIIDQLPADTQNRIRQERIDQQIKLDQSIAINKAQESALNQKYQTLISNENNNVAKLKVFFADQQNQGISSNRTIPINQADKAGLKQISGNSGVSRIVTANLSLQTVLPTLNSCLPDNLTIEEKKILVEKLGLGARIISTTTDAYGYFSYDLPLLTISANTNIYVTYLLTENIKNRPVTRLSIGQDPDAPQLDLQDCAIKTINQKNKGIAITLNGSINESGKVLINHFNENNELLSSEVIPVVTGQRIEYLIDSTKLHDGLHHFALQAVDTAGNTSFPYGTSFIVDTIAPSAGLLSVPQYINPQRTSLNVICREPGVSYNLALTSPNGLSDGTYSYQLTATDQAENLLLVTGTIVFDSTAPSAPMNLAIAQSSEKSTVVYWAQPTDDVLSEYAIIKTDLQNKIIDQATANSELYYDKNNLANQFVKYQIQAIDQAANTSNYSEPIIAFPGNNKIDGRLTPEQEISLNYNDCTLSIPIGAVSQNNLVVIQELPPTKNTGSPVYRLLASATKTFARSVTIDISFSPEYVNEQHLKPESLRIAYWNGTAWAADGLFNQSINLADGIASVQTTHFTDFAIVGDVDYRAFDFTTPTLRFADLRSGDYVDPTITINILANDPTTAINTANMWFVLDNQQYQIPSSSFTADNLLGNRGTIALNLSTYINLSYGQHQLDVFVTDMAGNTENAKLYFSTDQKFEIKNVLPVPNPFDEKGMHFTYQLSRSAENISIKIYDTNGRIIKIIDNCSNQTGFNKTFWDGRDQDGLFVANDVYIYTVIVETPDSKKEIIKGTIAAIR